MQVFRMQKHLWLTYAACQTFKKIYKTTASGGKENVYSERCSLHMLLMQDRLYSSAKHQTCQKVQWK